MPLPADVVEQAFVEEGFPATTRSIDEKEAGLAGFHTGGDDIEGFGLLRRTRVNPTNLDLPTFLGVRDANHPIL